MGNERFRSGKSERGKIESSLMIVLLMEGIFNEWKIAQTHIPVPTPTLSY